MLSLALAATALWLLWLLAGRSLAAALAVGGLTGGLVEVLAIRPRLPARLRPAAVAMAVTLALAAIGAPRILAAPAAMIGFAGPRVIKDTTQAELPPGFQTAEFLLDHGLIDAIVTRQEMKSQLISYLDFMTYEKQRLADNP